MEEILTPEMKEVIASLGALIKADARCAAIESSIAAYESCDELNQMIAEYNTQQNLLSDLYAKNGEDEAALDLRDTIQRNRGTSGLCRLRGREERL